MKVNIVESKECELVLDFELPVERVNSEIEKVFRETSQSAKLDGFRQGKAPEELVRKKYDSIIREKVLQNLIKENLFSALKERGITPIDTPQIENIIFKPGIPLTFRVIIEKHPEIKPQGYRGLKLTKQVKKITTKDIEEALTELCEQNAFLVESPTGVVTEKSFVVIDYDIFYNGKLQPELSAKNQLLDLSSVEFFENLPLEIVNLNKGAEKTFKSKFTDNFFKKEFAGKEIFVKVKIKEIKEKKLPTIDDEFAKDLGCNTLIELKEKIKLALEKRAEEVAQENLEKQIEEQLLQQNKFTIPKSVFYEQKKYLMASIQRKFFSNRGKFNENFWEERCNKVAEDQVRLAYILNAIAKKEKIEVTEDEISKQCDELIKANPDSKEAIEKYFQENISHLIPRIKIEKVLQYIIKNAKIKVTVV